MRLTEENIESVVREYLRNEGYNVYPKEARGVDIKAMHPLKRRYYFIEVKGEPSREYVRGKKKGRKKKPEAIGAQRTQWFLSALGEILQRMRQKYGNYAIAFPDNKYFRNRIKQLPKLVRHILQLEFFVVNEKREISKLTPAAIKWRRVF